MLSTILFVILLAAGGAGFGWLVWRWPDLGIALLMLALPAYGVRSFLGPLPVNALDAFALIFVAVTAVRWYQSSGHRLPARPFYWITGIIAIAATISMFIAPEFWPAVGFWKSYFLLPLGVFFAISYYLHQPGMVTALLRGLFLTGLYIALFAIVQKITGGWMVPAEYWLEGEGGRVTSIYSYANAVGLFVGPIAVLAAGYAWHLAARWQAHHATWTAEHWFDLGLAVLTAIAGALAVWYAKSDGALFGLLAGVMVMLFYHRRTRPAAAIVAALTAVIVVGGYLPTTWQDKLTFTDWSGQVRVTIWQETADLIRDNWRLGVGLGGYPRAFAQYHQADYIEIFWYPHNILLNFWVELGLLGVIGMTAAVAWSAVLAWRRRYLESWVIPAIGALAAIVVHGLVDVPYFKGDLAILWWLVIALIIAVPKIKSHPA